MADLKVLGILGSLRKQSFNGYAIEAARDLMPQGSTLDIFDLHDIPPFNQDDERNPPPKVVEMKKRVRAADAILFCTPEYNYSIPGVLKNAIDWGTRPYGDNCWEGKPTAIMGASTGMLGTARAQYHLRQVLGALDMKVINYPEVMIAQAAKRFEAEGKLVDEVSRELIRKQMQALIDWTKLLQAAHQSLAA